MSIHPSFFPRPFEPLQSPQQRKAAFDLGAAERDLAVRGAMWVTYAASLYPLLLCFLNTRVARMPNAALIVAELIVLMGALPILA